MQQRSRVLILTLATILTAGMLGVASPSASAATTAQAVGTGWRHTCALTAKGGVKCWGDGPEGQLGDGKKESRKRPVKVKGLDKGVVQIAVGGDHACALKAAGVVLCWGANWDGQIGDGTNTDRPTPRKVKGLQKVVAIGGGTDHVCAITRKGALKCWGRNADGMLGDGTTEERRSPVQVKGMKKGVTAVAAGVGSHTCAIQGKGLKCWGRNFDGQLGNGEDLEKHTPVQVKGMKKGVTAVAAGASHTCAIKGKGTLMCWGSDGDGRLGDGDPIMFKPLPVLVKGMKKGVVAVSAGEDHTCAIKGKGTLMCWGRNEDGEIGDGTQDGPRNTPVQVKKMKKKITAVSAGGRFTCAIKGKGILLCWGSNGDGQLGDGTKEMRTTPVKIKL